MAQLHPLCCKAPQTLRKTKVFLCWKWQYTETLAEGLLCIHPCLQLCLPRACSYDLQYAKLSWPTLVLVLRPVNSLLIYSQLLASVAHSRC